MKLIYSLALLLTLPLIPAFSMGGSPPPLTILMVPAEPNMVRLGMDMVEREDVLLMSYAPQSKPQDPFLHVWNGNTWLRVPAEKYASGTFLRTKPDAVLVLGGNNALTTVLIEQAVDWSPEVLNVAPGSIAEVINSFGRLFRFSRSDWKWFAAEYDLKLEDLNQGKKEEGWYDSHSPEDIPKTRNPLFKKSKESDVPDSSLEAIDVTPVTEDTAIPLEPTPVEDTDTESFSM